jgi:DNA-binding NarL/FixJ family response regulator
MSYAISTSGEGHRSSWDAHSSYRQCTRSALPRVLLADDQEEMLRTIAELLEGEVDVIAAVGDAKRVVEIAPGLAPDILILDVCMPELTGIEAAIRLKESGLDAKVIFLTVHEDPDFVQAAFAAGALGYVLKQSVATDLVPAIRSALAGQLFISPSLRMK